MQIHSLCLVKNECDIIAQSLGAAAEWSDFIYVYDNGSTDGTWELVLEQAQKVRQVIPFRRDERPFHDSLRKIPFMHYRHRAATDDWWCILDADEFYIDSPKKFLTNVPSECDTVWSASFQFYLTDKDVERFREEPARYGDDVPVEHKCRYYINNWSELRFFRHSSRLRWGSKAAPFPLMRAYDRRIRLKHYQYRSPQQIERRLATRRYAMTRGIFPHESRSDWTEAILGKTRQVKRPAAARVSTVWTDRVLNSSELIYDDRSHYVITEHLLPKITDSSATITARLKCRLYCAIADLLPG